MHDRRQILLWFVLTTTTVSLLVGITAIWFLYRTGMDEQVSELQFMANEQAQLIEAVAQVDLDRAGNVDAKKASATTTSRILEAHGRIGGFGETGEFVIGRRQGDDIVFLLERRFNGTAVRKSVPFTGTDWAKPMRLALSGERGWTIGRDYRGKTVLAAHEPLTTLNCGLVAKQDLAEVRAPFIRAAILACVVALAIVVLGAAASWRVTAPLVQRIQQSEARVRTILDNAAEGIISCDTQGRIESFNPSAEVLFGRAEEEVLGQTIQTIIPELSLNHDSSAAEEIESANRNGPVATYRARRKNGSLVHIDLTVGTVALSQHPAFTIIVRDITERLRSRQEREQLIAELEGKNAELERYAYTVSHDLKGPLITLKSYADLLTTGVGADDSETRQKYLARMHKAVGRMLRMIDELLDLSRIGRSTSDIEGVSLDEIAHEAVAILAGAVEQAHAEVAIFPGLPNVPGDRTQLFEVMQNLIENALKYMGDQPHPRVEIGSVVEGNGVVVYVRDNGIGIDPRFQNRVFHLFEQLDPTAEGTGVGLALVKRIVEAHGGCIWVESKGAGFGSTFSLHIPAMSPPEEATAISAQLSHV